MEQDNINQHSVAADRLETAIVPIVQEWDKTFAEADEQMVARREREMVTQSELRSRGWTRTAIRKTLGEPDLRKPNPVYWRGPDMCLYRLDRVIAAESTPQWQAWREQSRIRSERARAAARKTHATKCSRRIEELFTRVDDQTREGAITGWRDLPAPDLHASWVALFNGHGNEANAPAIWMGNRLIKAYDPTMRGFFYSLKDGWMRQNQNYLIAGRVVREEGKRCWTCDGEGFLYDEISWNDPEDVETSRPAISRPAVSSPPETCPKCQGTGLYRPRTLYLHQFDIQGKRYSFHSYVRPKMVLPEPGEDKEFYGGRFSEAELAALPLPLPGLLRVLAYHASTHWGMIFDLTSDRFISATTLPGDAKRPA